MNLKRIKFLSLPVLLTIALAGCVSDSSYDNSATNNIANITEEATTTQNNNSDQITDKNINGVWRITMNNISCQLITTHTKQGKYYLASSRSCPEPIHRVSAWKVTDNKLNLYNKQNELILTLEKPMLDIDDNSDVFLTGTSAEGSTINMSR